MTTVDMTDDIHLIALNCTFNHFQIQAFIIQNTLHCQNITLNNLYFLIFVLIILL